MLFCSQAAIQNHPSTGLPMAMIVTGGINCFQIIVTTSEEKAVAYNTWSNNGIEVHEQPICFVFETADFEEVTTASCDSRMKSAV